MADTYFSLLSDEELRRILHFYKNHSTHHLRSNSPFAHALTGHFNILRLKVTESSVSKFMSFVAPKRISINCGHQDITEGSNNDSQSDQFFINHCLGSVESITLFHPIDTDGAVKEWVDAIFHQVGKQIHGLSVGYRFAQDSWRSPFVAQWASLCPNLKRFESKGQNLELLMPMWNKVGASLRHIYLDCRNDSLWPASLDAINAHCPNLEDIILRDPLENNIVPVHDFVRFISSFGASLRNIFLSKIDPQSCTQIVHKCPNARFVYTAYGQDLSSAAALGNQLERLIVELVGGTNLEAMESAMWNLKYLITLAACSRDDYDLGPDSLYALSSAPLPDLQTLIVRSIVCPFDVIKSFARCTSSLLDMEVTIPTFHHGEEMFKILGARNPKLRRVHITESATVPENSLEEDVLGVLAHILKIFKRWSNLRKVELMLKSQLPEFDLMSNLLVPYRNRQVYLRFAFDDSRAVVYSRGGLTYPRKPEVETSNTRNLQ